MKHKQTRNINKKNIILLGAGAIVLCLLIVSFFWFTEKKKAIFYIDGKEMDSLEVKLEYGSEYSLLPKDLKMQAKTPSETDITDKIVSTSKDIKEVGSYKIEYTVEDDEIKKSTFVVTLQVEDKTAPVFSGINEITWKLGEDFSYKPGDHDIHATDIHDGNLDDKITYEGSVDIQTEGTYEIIYSVVDSFKHQATHNLKVHVQEKQVVNTSVDDLYKDPRSITPNIINPNSTTVLVNKYNAIPDGWEPSDLVAITSNSGRDMYLRQEAASAWEELNRAAQAKGINIQVISSIRSASYQANLFNNYYAVDGANAFLYSALSRRSEHELGLAIDVSYDGQLHEDLLNTSVGQFMNDEGYKYGFILRYPSDKIAITGYGFEAWHYRYLGTTLATELKQRNLVLEEY